MNGLLTKMVLWRRDLHRQADLSFNEYATQLYIEGILDELGIFHQRVGVTGVLAKLNLGFGISNGEGVRVLRADIDALEISETTGNDFACTEGRMHACGHDIHASALLGALSILQSEGCNREIWGLFQPGEEVHPGGASVILREGVFEGVDVKWFLAQHCSPELECGVLGVRQGQFMASTDEIHIKVKGVGGHGAMPHLGKDAVLCGSAIVVGLQQINSRNNNTFVPSVISIGRFVADGATNILPDEVILEGTFRTMDESWRRIAWGRIKEVAIGVAQAHGCSVEVDVREGYPSVFNDPAMVSDLQEVASGICAVADIERRMTAEDFGFYGQRYKSLMYRLGVGRTENGVNVCGALHTGRFNPDERALEIGASVLAKFAMKH